MDNNSHFKKRFSEKILKSFCELTQINEVNFTETLFNKFDIYHPLYEQEEIYAKAEKYWIDVLVPHKVAVYMNGMELVNNALNIDTLFVKKEDFVKRLIDHDLSKFSAIETYGYMNNDFKGKNSAIQKQHFKLAWHHHKQHNAHHPEYWIDVNKKGEIEVLPMNKIDVLEMVADWLGAGESYSISFKEWAKNNLHHFNFHQETKKNLSFIFQVIGFDYSFDK